MISNRLCFLGLQLLALSYSVQSVLMITANTDDVKKIARNFVSESLADKIAELITLYIQPKAKVDYNENEDEVHKQMNSISEEFRDDLTFRNHDILRKDHKTTKDLNTPPVRYFSNEVTSQIEPKYWKEDTDEFLQNNDDTSRKQAFKGKRAYRAGQMDDLHKEFRKIDSQVQFVNDRSRYNEQLNRKVGNHPQFDPYNTRLETIHEEIYPNPNHPEPVKKQSHRKPSQPNGDIYKFDKVPKKKRFNNDNKQKHSKKFKIEIDKPKPISLDSNNNNEDHLINLKQAIMSRIKQTDIKNVKHSPKKQEHDKFDSDKDSGDKLDQEHTSHIGHHPISNVKQDDIEHFQHDPIVDFKEDHSGNNDKSHTNFTLELIDDFEKDHVDDFKRDLRNKFQESDIDDGKRDYHESLKQTTRDNFNNENNEVDKLNPASELIGSAHRLRQKDKKKPQFNNDPYANKENRNYNKQSKNTPSENKQKVRNKPHTKYLNTDRQKQKFYVANKSTISTEEVKSDEDRFELHKKQTPKQRHANEQTAPKDILNIYMSDKEIANQETKKKQHETSTTDVDIQKGDSANDLNESKTLEDESLFLRQNTIADPDSALKVNETDDIFVTTAKYKHSDMKPTSKVDISEDATDRQTEVVATSGNIKLPDTKYDYDDEDDDNK